MGKSSGWIGVASVALAITALALVSACGGSTVASVDASCADAPSPPDAAPSVDPGRIGMCDPDRVRPGGNSAPGLTECGSDEECVDGVNGRCNFVGPAWTLCSYDSCFGDEDCPAGTRCACGVGPSGANRCLPDHCCGCDAPDCAVSLGCEGRGHPVALECHGRHDACRTDADCGSDEYCTHEPNDSSQTPVWRCTPPWCWS